MQEEATIAKSFPNLLYTEPLTGLTNQTTEKVWGTLYDLERLFEGYTASVGSSGIVNTRYPLITGYKPQIKLKMLITM